MTAIDFTPVIASLVTVIAVLVLLIRSMAEKKKNGNPGNNSDTKVDHALMLKSLERIEKATEDGFNGIEKALKDGFERIEEKLP